MKIYVITKGEYSDYHICAVATDPVKADLLAEFFSSKWGEAEVEEYDTEDAPDLMEGKKVFRIHYGEDGSTESVKEWYNDCWDTPPFILYEKSKCVVVHVLAKNEEDAIKIGAERRAKFLAEKMGL